MNWRTANKSLEVDPHPVTLKHIKIFKDRDGAFRGIDMPRSMSFYLQDGALFAEWFDADDDGMEVSRYIVRVINWEEVAHSPYDEEGRLLAYISKWTGGDQ
tara:strand:- start:592 stop:894 length:303 start_codon:yes stop_codon:yes gene_type:complete